MDRPLRDLRERISNRSTSRNRSTKADDHRILEGGSSRRNEARESYKHPTHRSDRYNHRVLTSGSSSQTERDESYERRHAYKSNSYRRHTLGNRSRSRGEPKHSPDRLTHSRDSRNPSKTMRQPQSGRSGRRHDKIRPLEYIDLKTMVEMKTSEDITETLARDEARLKELLRGGRTLLDAAMVEMLLGVFGKMLDADRHIGTSLARVLNLIDVYNFDKAICHFIRDLQTVTCQRRRAKAPLHLQNALKIARALFKASPAQTRRKVHDITREIRTITVNFRLDDVGLCGMEGLLRGTKRKSSFDSAGTLTKRIVERDRKPKQPSNFRKIPVFPQLQDVQSDQPFIRPNVTNGAYQCIDHYLDVQYRLLREDYIRPLRDGIAELRRSDLRGGATNGPQSNKVYRDVRILSVLSDRNGNSPVLHKIQFSTRCLQYVRWQNNKRLMFGNLLCFSSDMFQNEVLFAVVAQRKPMDLEDGYVTVAFTRDESTIKPNPTRNGNNDRFDELPGTSRQAPPEVACSIDMKKVYIMVESDAYFETYRHVLAGLRDTKQLPLQRYIVGCAKDVHAPKYLRPDIGERVGYDFSSITGDDKMIDVLGQDWPSPDKLGLNDSQTAALKLALTSELAIIQGPPGTGKTHVGIAIMDILLRNKTIWSRSGDTEDNDSNNTDKSVSHSSDSDSSDNDPIPRSPILVVCYTNHALDMFVTEISKFSKNIVRLGGRCQNDFVKPFCLHEIKLRNMNHSSFEMDMLQDQMKRLARKIFPRSAKLLESHSSIQRLCSPYVPQRLQEQFDPSYQTEIPVYQLYYWLGFVLRDIDEYPGQEWVPGAKLRGILGHVRRRRDPANQGAANMIRTDMQYRRGRMNENNRNWTEEADIIQQQRILYSDEVAENETGQPFGRSDPFMKIDDADESPFSEYSTKKCELAMRQMLSERTLMTEEEELRVYRIGNLSLGDRWRLYRTWIDRWRDDALRSLRASIAKYSQFARNAAELERSTNAAILRRADVVAATTSGAAKYRDLLYNLDTKIVVVEEAAEVMEAHIITAMPKTTQHLILIGDHQQLKPSTTVYELAKKYHLDTSLFERMVKVKIPHVTLNVQHRMRPEIADLLRPRIYRDLVDHESVQRFGEIAGITKPMFFVSHRQSEDRLMDGKSKQNKHEVDFLVALCDYLLKQGYSSKQITILTMYSGQLFAFRNEMTEAMEQVRVTAVDNFQGEENDIILLSLVRSNEEAKIGFLAVENRICVALSRAKKAFYCIGNLELLAKTNRLWKGMKEHLEKTGCIGESLMLKCGNHSGCQTPVRTKFDFNMVPQGGCGQPCRTRLYCGHACARSCHPDNDHSHVRCMKPCDKMLGCGHKCTKICADLCDPCNEVCGKTLDCGHECRRKCYESCHPCKVEVIKILNCGHEQKVLCEEPLDEVKCQKKIEVTLRCGHQTEIHCMLSGTVDKMICREKCTDYLDCLHECKGSCGECYQGRLHIPCTEPCGRVLVCGHKCESKCSSCPPCEHECETRCVHSTCEKSCEEPCVPCREKCSWRCRHKQCNKLCSEPCDRDPCNEACDKVLGCGHSCIGLCGEPCPELCRICDEAEVTEIFFGDEDEENARFVELKDCGHVFTHASLDMWMNQKEEDSAIKMKACPRCATAIWKSTRYGNVINRLLQSINKVKTTKFGELADIRQQKDRLLREVRSSRLSLYNDTAEFVLRKLENLKNAGELYVTEKMFRRLQSLREVARVEANLSTAESLVPQKYKTAFKCDVEAIYVWIMLKRCQISTKEDERFSDEIERLKRILEFFDVLANSENQLQIDSKVEEMVEELGKLLLERFTPYNDEFTVKSEVDRLFESIYELAPVLKSGFGITTEEKKMICSAMQFNRKGHWFECPNGHVYAIGECGGATEKSKCPECNADIGGTSHQLDPTNRISAEMDGATHSAYEEDMRTNYIPDDMLANLRREGFG